MKKTNWLKLKTIRKLNSMHNLTGDTKVSHDGYESIT